MKKTISKLLAGSLLLAACALAAQERDFGFLPAKVAVYGANKDKAITRDQAILLLKSKFTPEQLKVMSEGEIRTAVRALAMTRFERVVMEQFLRKNNITPDPEEMAKELRRLHDSLPPAQREAIEKQLLADGSSFEAYLRKSVNDRDSVTRYGFIQWVERDTAGKITVGDAEVESFYRLNQAMFLVPETLVLSRILTAERAGADALHTRLALGEKFAALAKGRGGKYGEFRREDLDREILDAVDALKPGQYSRVIQQKDGWAIFHMDDRVAAAYVPLDDMREFIRKEVRKTKILGEIQRIMYAESKRLNFELTL